MKVLIVEDNLDDRGILRSVFHAHGWETIEAGNGAEGLDLTRLHNPGLIISDALMPCMDGFQFLRIIKMHPEFKKIPFIFYSAVYTGFKEEDLAISLGAEAFIVKPKEPEELWGMLTGIMKAHEHGEKKDALGELTENDEDFIKKYGEVVTTKIEEKIRELEDALARRKAAEEALQAQFTIISTVFDAINAIVFVTDLEERLLFLNRQGINFFGDRWEGKKWTEHLFQGQVEPVALRRNTHEGSPETSSWEFHSTRTGRWYLCFDRLIPWTDGKVVRLTIAIDITERKEVERLKNEMISAVSHEMRTPLTAMLGFTGFMLDNEVPSTQQKEFLGIIHRETEKLSDLIGDFLSLQRLESRQGKVPLLPTDIRPILEEVAYRYQVLSKNHQVTVTCPGDLPTISGNRRDLSDMIDNLVSNAMKFSPSGGAVSIEARRHDDFLTIQVRDEGIGIAMALFERIFEPFYQADSGDSRRFQGTGLGLALVRKVVESHDGRIGVESTIGRGSTFTVSLPVRKERCNEAWEDEQAVE